MTGVRSRYGPTRISLQKSFGVIVIDAQSDEVAAAQFAAYRQIEERRSRLRSPSTALSRSTWLAAAVALRRAYLSWERV